MPGPTGNGTLPGTVIVPGAAQPETGTATATGASPTATRTSPTATRTTPAPTGTGAVTWIQTGTAGGKSDVLVDQNGCALYLNTSDTSTTTDVSTSDETTWIPVTAPAQVRGGGLDQAKLGTFQRPNGKTQVTYNGHQLYRYSGDQAPGEAKGQGVDGKYWLVGKNGDPVR
jgi:predicted lipoprotein with Yx(FWY)xxD motif